MQACAPSDSALIIRTVSNLDLSINSRGDYGSFYWYDSIAVANTPAQSHIFQNCLGAKVVLLELIQSCQSSGCIPTLVNYLPYDDDTLCHFICLVRSPNSKMILVKLTLYSLIVLQYLDRQTESCTLAEMVDDIPFSIRDDEWDIDADSLRAAIKPAVSQHLITTSANGSGSARQYEITATGRDFLENMHFCLENCGMVDEL
jgi:hypothetical protein